MTADAYFVLSLPLDLNHFIELLTCLWLPSWQQEIIMISAHQCLIISLNIPQCWNIFKPYVWSNKDQNTHHDLRLRTHTLGLSYCDTQVKPSIHPLTDGTQEKKEKAGNNPDTECNLRVSRQRFPVDLWTAKGNASPFSLVLFKHKSNNFLMVSATSQVPFFSLFIFYFVTFLFLIRVFYYVTPWLLIESFHSFRTGFGPTLPNVSTVSSPW